MSSDTTTKTAHKMNRKWLDSEISGQYVEIAEKRLNLLIDEPFFINSLAKENKTDIS